MAGDINRVVLVGRLTRDPELKQTNTGTSLCRFSVANNRTYIQNGEKKEEVSFFNCVAWGRQGEVINQYCQKGKQLAVEGRIRQNSWQDNEGKKRSTVDIVVEQVQFIGGSAQQERSETSSSWDAGAQFQQSAAPVMNAPSSVSPDMKASLPQQMDDDDIPF